MEQVPALGQTGVSLPLVLIAVVLLPWVLGVICTRQARALTLSYVPGPRSLLCSINREQRSNQDVVSRGHFAFPKVRRQRNRKVSP